MAEQVVTTVEVILRADDGSGNEPIEATTHLPIVPRVGDEISVWVNETENLYGPHEEFLAVKGVVLCAWAPERIEVAVSTDGHTVEAIQRIFEAAERNEQP